MISQRGNALFLILIAVALFAALSYALTTSGRGHGSIDRETAMLGAGSIAQYIALIRQEVRRMEMVNKCDAENFDWRNDVWKRLDGSPAPGILHPARIPKPGCTVFSDYGGPVPAVTFENLAEPSYNSAGPPIS